MFFVRDRFFLSIFAEKMMKDGMIDKYCKSVDF